MIDSTQNFPTDFVFCFFFFSRSHYPEWITTKLIF